jgi:hypothetical protein
MGRLPAATLPSGTVGTTNITGRDVNAVISANGDTVEVVKIGSTLLTTPLAISGTAVLQVFLPAGQTIYTKDTAAHPAATWQWFGN